MPAHQARDALPTDLAKLVASFKTRRDNQPAIDHIYTQLTLTARSGTVPQDVKDNILSYANDRLASLRELHLNATEFKYLERFALERIRNGIDIYISDHFPSHCEALILHPLGWPKRAGALR
jgi:hypothetical protein